MDFFDMSDDVIQRGIVHCPNGGVCNASSGCAHTTLSEIQNNDLNLQFNSSANS